MTALDLSSHYSVRIDSIPIAPPTPPLIAAPSFEDEFETMSANGVRTNGHDYEHHKRFNAGAEDAALEFEREMLQGSPGPKVKKDAKKRPLTGGESDMGGDLDQLDSKDDMSGPSLKRRKLDNETGMVTNGVDHTNGQDPPLSLKLSLSKLKGKAKQIQREPSHDSVSVSATPKARKKPGPKKKVGLALELENDQASRPASLMGDVTPSASRPTSPVPHNTTMVYELDELMPPMKKAKKVDDAALVKRIKTLEETQRKVWTNIARRDVAKVMFSIPRPKPSLF